MLHQNFQQEYDFGKILANLQFSPLKFQTQKPLEKLFFVIKKTTPSKMQTKFDSERKETPMETCTKEELKEFLNSKPRPNWIQRIGLIQKYNRNLVTNWQVFCDPKKCKCENKVILDKKLFELFIELTKGITKETNKTAFVKLCRNSQRGVVKMMEKRGFRNKSNYLRTQLVFVKEN
ncbi:hypothetical protein M0813_23187 [Anaeramoeba flamelloides]|uniref:Uncharacterized protein n=1 Tax=Anaeramoeba flamelloides TaxID=1746091 RepID=A0ABQ8Y9T9_9EUKA|nr:hypothetical protein M0813_23187 [Anaeramoeba flamelloides]